MPEYSDINNKNLIRKKEKKIKKKILRKKNNEQNVDEYFEKQINTKLVDCNKQYSTLEYDT